MILISKGDAFFFPKIIIHQILNTFSLSLKLTNKIKLTNKMKQKNDFHMDMAFDPLEEIDNESHRIYFCLYNKLIPSLHKLNTLLYL